MPLRMRSPLPALDGVTDWINGELSVDELTGKPVLVHFWSLSCYLCHDTAGLVAQWRDLYGPRGLVVVAVHNRARLTNSMWKKSAPTLSARWA
jgi:thiol-disulfide isomerase/thioredoxin